MKPLIRLLSGLIIVFTAALLVIAASEKISGGDFSALRFLGILREKKTSSSELLLTEIRGLRKLNTVDYIWKTVFPFDFLDESINFNSIMQTLRSGKGTVDSLLRPAEQEYLETRNLAERIGFRIGGKSTDFVVVTASVRCGVDLSEIRIKMIRPIKSGEGGHVAVYPPSPRITEVVIEDPNEENYPYPDVKLSPRNWKNLSVFIEDRLRKRADDLGILKTADLNLKQFLFTFLTQAGYSQVDFPQE